MPIAQRYRHFYGLIWRTVTRPRILARAKSRCECCGVENYARVKRTRGWWWDVRVNWEKGVTKTWRNEKGVAMGPRRPTGSKVRTVWIVLTIAHLDHTPGNDVDANLKAMCQWCHLAHDRNQHLDNGKETRLDRKDSDRPLLKGEHFGPALQL